jgi:N-acylneuraminate cytidylyltransferase
MWKIDASGRMIPLLAVPGIAEPYNAPRQVLPPVFWQTGHIDAIRSAVILAKESMSGDVILPVLVDPRYTIDIDSLSDWRRAEWLVGQGDLEMVFPGRKPRSLPKDPALLVLDFDGVITDNRVWVDGEGRELAAANRSDGLRLGRLRRAGIEVLVLSTETNPVVAARCKKLNLPYMQGLAEKGEALQAVLKERGVDASRVVYLGNDINDLPCFSLVGCAVVVADAWPEARREADLILKNPGGAGAVGELCDLLLEVKRSGLEKENQ